MNNTLYDDQKVPKIQAVFSNEIEENESELISNTTGWSQTRVAAISPVIMEMASMSELKKSRFLSQGSSRPIPAKYVLDNNTGRWSEHKNLTSSWLEEPGPSELPAFQAIAAAQESDLVDFRPHLTDPHLGELLIDSGSMVSAFPPEPGDLEDNSLSLKAVNGSKIKCYGKKEFSIKIGRKSYPFLAYKADVQAPVLGWDFLRRFKLNLEWNDCGDILIVDRKANISHILNFKSLSRERSLRHKRLAISAGLDRNQEEFDLPFQVSSMEALGESKSTVVHKEDINILPDSPYKTLLSKYPELLTQDFNSKTKANITHRIILKEGAKPFKSKTRRLLPGSPKAEQAQKDWKQLVELGIVERVSPGESNLFSSPLHFAEKGYGTLRPVGDYRLLNDRTELDVHPLPHIRDYTHDIAGCNIFSKVDLRKGFHQIEIDSRDRHLTTVTTPWGLFQFKRLAMGMANSAQAFQRWVSSVVSDIPGVFAYLDDLLIYNKNEQEHLQTIETVFKRLSEAGMAIALNKCVFGQSELEYLGYKIDQAGLSPLKKKVDALQNFPVPKKQKDLLAFLGALNYYRSSLPRLKASESASPESVEKSRSPAAVLDPLYKLATCKLKKVKGEFEKIWSSNNILPEAFQDAKNLLTKAITLNYPVPSAPLALSTDASQVCLGASLEQFVNGQWTPLGLWSKSLKPEQQRYSTYRREILAIKYAIRHFIDEINGRTLTVYTDHRPILGSWKNPDLQKHDTVAMNALNEIAQWTSDIRYKPGKELLVPDLMSRPFGLGTAHQVQSDPEYIPPSETLAALQEVALNIVTPSSIAEAQKSCDDVKSHIAGNKPRNAKMGYIDISGTRLYCEISDPLNPRPLVPKSSRDLIVNLLHHQDHPGAKETVRRIAKDYYWPCLKSDVEGFVKTCHPCQIAKQSPTVNPGVGNFNVPDKRFSAIHLDVVGPLPESEGMRYILSVFCRTSRWTECYPMRNASSADCCKAFLEWTSRYGVPNTAISDNGNSFIANLYKDIMSTFGIEVRFTPAYHPATNGAIERRHQTIKNSIKAALVDMGAKHQNNWMRALPWVMLGKRVAVQPDLDASAAMLTFGKSVALPGQLLGDPGPPLSNLETKALLEELYKLDSRPALQTSSTAEPIDISVTNKATHVYVKVHEPRGLSNKFEGPFKVVDRPSRSQVTVRVGSFVDGRPRTQTFHWSSCKIAHMREDAMEGSRPNVGRRPDPPKVQSQLTPPPTELQDGVAEPAGEEAVKCQQTANPESGKIQTTNSTRPIRSTRNPKPQYIDGIGSEICAYFNSRKNNGAYRLSDHAQTTH